MELLKLIVAVVALLEVIGFCLAFILNDLYFFDLEFWIAWVFGMGVIIWFCWNFRYLVG